MNKAGALLAGFGIAGVVLSSAQAADEGAIQTTVTVDAAKVMRKMDPRRIGRAAASYRQGDVLP